MSVLRAYIVLDRRLKLISATEFQEAGSPSRDFVRDSRFNSSVNEIINMRNRAV